MKWIKPRNKFLNEEAKIKDVILPRQAREVKRVWGEQYLELEEIEATDKIKQGKWKLSDEDKIKVLGVFFGADLKKIYEFFGGLPEKLKDVLSQSIDLDLLKGDDKWSKILDNFDIQMPSINQISVLTDPIFRKISVSETTATEVIIRDENGRPVMGEDGRPTKRRREEGEIIFSNNLVNINTFLADFNRLFPDATVDATRFQSGDIQRLVSSSREDFGGDNYRVEVDLYGRDLFLSIKHNPKDILNISISRFYSSCQHLDSGGYRERAFGNVIDPNSIPAFLVFDTPIYDRSNDLISEQLPLSRMMIRNLEKFETNDKTELYFDRAYPDRMKSIIGDMVEKYSDNKEMSDSENAGRYLFTPDAPSDLSIREPYMDRLGLDRGQYIGVNTTKLYLNQSHNWSKTKISPKAKISEIIIETPNIPSNFFEIPLNPEWIKIKFLKLNDFTVFQNIKSNSYAFDKCKFNGNLLDQIKEYNPDLKKLQITACQIKDLNLSKLGDIDELQLIYTLDPEDLSKALEGVNAKKLVLSGDLVSDPENKKLINSLKGKGVKVQIVGPVI
jgi:hypothetical protein